MELTIEKLVPGGDGLARHEGKVIFVPMTLPGEKVRVRIVDSKKDFARAEPVEILTPSPDRVTPPCPVFGRCGGCDWQHISYEAQLREKVAMVEDALRRTGGLIFPGLAIEPGKPWRYRNRIQIHRRPSGEGGFLARTSHAVVPIKTCPVASEAFDPLFSRPGNPTDSVTSVPFQEREAFREPTVRERRAEALSGYPHKGRDGSGGNSGNADDEGRRYSAWTHPQLGAAGDFLISDEPDATGPGIIVSRTGDGALESKPIPEYLGPRAEGTKGEIAVDILGKTIRFDLRCFFQSNLEMIEKLIPFALEGLEGEEALDLYCGVGLFGAFLKDRFKRVLAVESNSVSLEYALRNIGDTHHFLRGRLEDLLLEERGHLAGCRPDAIVVDPPRDGLEKTVREFLIAKKPARIVYVSCNPVTLARDLKTLLAAGFILDDLRLFDLYPQTAHVEAVAKLSAVK
ncbi:MAG: class I SAM-dependent RNA methyltransferase [Fibrobacterota bacterium]|nr:class I SAM-dependent RNA methyltransferase [Fibrobacterota bacterium]